MIKKKFDHKKKMYQKHYFDHFNFLKTDLGSHLIFLQMLENKIDSFLAKSVLFLIIFNSDHDQKKMHQKHFFDHDPKYFFFLNYLDQNCFDHQKKIVS